MSLEKFMHIVQAYESRALNGNPPLLQAAGSVALGRRIKGVRTFGYGITQPVEAPAPAKGLKMRQLVGAWGVYECDYEPAYHIALSDNRLNSGITVHRIPALGHSVANRHEAEVLLPMEDAVIRFDPNEGLFLNEMLVEPSIR